MAGQGSRALIHEGDQAVKLREEHVKAVGGCAPCEFEPVPGEVATEGGASVRVVDESKSAWIGIELVDRKGRAVPNEPYEVTLPDGRPVTGTLDRAGKVRIEGIDPGTCTVTFPRIDRRDFVEA